MQVNRLAHAASPQFPGIVRPDRRLQAVNTARSSCGKRGSILSPDRPGGSPEEGGQECARVPHRTESQGIGSIGGGYTCPTTRLNGRAPGKTGVGRLVKARRRGGLVLRTMSTPAPPLVITTPTEVGGAPSMLAEAARDRGAVSAAPRSGALPEAPARAKLRCARERRLEAVRTAARGVDRAGSRLRISGENRGDASCPRGGLQSGAIPAVPGRRAAVFPGYGMTSSCAVPRRASWPWGDVGRNVT